MYIILYKGVLHMKKVLTILLLVLSLSLTACGDEPEQGSKTQDVTNETTIDEKAQEEEKEILNDDEENKEELSTTDTTASREDEIESVINNRINEGEYNDSTLEKIQINKDMSQEDSDKYIALVYLTFDIKNSTKTANDMMRMYSDDLSATLADKGVEDVTEVAVFWKDEYNNRDVKYAYEYKDGKFFVSDIAGE